MSCLSACGVLRRLTLAIAALGALATAGQATPILLVEADTGKVLEQQEAGKPWYPASVTKLMTVYVALNAMREGRITPDTLMTVSPYAASMQPTKMGFAAGTQVTLDNALKMLLVKSANDMAVVIAEGVGGSVPSFVAEMNDTAARLGMAGSHFENPNGLPNSDQFTTARDLAVLARALIYHFPEHEMLFRIPAIKIGKRVLRNYNRLIDRYPGADGMKTGFICASGFNLVATATRGNKRLIAVILGAPSAVVRTEQAALLFEKGFQPSWSIFGASSPTLDTLADTGGAPTDMSPQICGRKRAVAAAENEDDSLFAGSGEGANSYAVSAAVAAGFSKGEGAALLQNLPPSMPPIPVFVGPRSAPISPESAMAPDEPPAPKKKKPAATANADPQAPAAKPKNTGAKADAANSDAAAAKPAAKPKPQAKEASTTTGTPAPAKKPAPAGASATAEPAAKPKPKPAKPAATDGGGDPLTFGPPPSAPTKPGA
ncbi:D-alanyl-D-alanine carboxypeptidase family protein [Xanthobacter sp. VNH20]|uniref:D-alanyl-D-alanine carboxypeptidase family protein n=1 Tax=Xanthobacter sp. VNH20 TaxID=3156616 RepID=UPI0032B41442